MNKSIIKHVILFSVLFLISGCFDIRREIKIYPNGSGFEKIYITFEKAVFDIFKAFASQDKTGRAQKKLDSLMDNSLWEKNLTNDFQRTPGVSIKELQVSSKEDGSKDVYVYYIFDDPSVLLRTVKETTNSISNQQNVNFSTLKFFDEGDKLRFRYVIRNASRSFDDTVALNLFSNLIQTKKVSYSFEMPFEVISSNAQSQSGNILGWEFLISDIMYNQVEMLAEMKREQGLDLPYAEIVDKTIERVDKNKSPLIRVQVYNANQEPVKIGTGIVVGEDLLVTNFMLMNLIEGQGYFSVKLNNDSLAGVDGMREKDLDPKLDLVFLRFNNNEKVKTLKYATLDNLTPGTNVKILYYPNTLSSVVYSIEGSIVELKKWGKQNKILEIKPIKPLTIEGGAVFNEKGEFLGMITTAYKGEVGRFYAVPSIYIRGKIK